MPRDATKYAGGHTSALGELFIADERERMQGEVYKFDSWAYLNINYSQERVAEASTKVGVVVHPGLASVAPSGLR